jgi:hypothetical protein
MSGILVVSLRQPKADAGSRCNKCIEFVTSSYVSSHSALDGADIIDGSRVFSLRCDPPLVSQYAAA